MAKRILCWHIQRASRQHIFTNFNKSINKFMPSDDGMISLLAQHFNASSTNNQSDLKRVPRINLTKPTRPYQPRRALMYVPGNDERKLSKISSLNADCICLDCEDGVAIDKKSSARQNIRKIYEGTNPLDFGRSEATVRVNSISSNHCKLDLLEIFKDLPQSNFPNSIHLPKVDDPEDLEEFCSFFNECVDGNINENKKVGLIIFVESARSLLQLESICLTAKKLEDKSPLVIEAIVFGSDDFVADIGAERTKSGIELIYARQRIVTVAKAFGLQAIDMVHIDFKDLEGLQAQSEYSAKMGFTGKQVIHPSQIEIVQNSYRPSKEKVEWAKELIKEFHVHQSEGKGAFTFRGSMIDAPLVKQAENIVGASEKF